MDSVLFKGVKSQYIDEFLHIFSEKITLKKGDYLWKAGDDGDDMYLLESGKLEVLVESGTVLASVESGALIGEVCVFGQKQRSADIRAAEDSTLIFIKGEEFRKRARAQDVGVLLISYNIATILSQRLVYAGDFMRKIKKTFEKMPATSEVEKYRKRFFEESLFN